jgi:acyl carrier protein
VSETSDVIDVLRVEIRNVKESLPANVPTDALLMTDLGLDSLDVVEFVARVEEVYRVSVPDDEWQELSTLDRIADYVCTHR